MSSPPVTSCLVDLMDIALKLKSAVLNKFKMAHLTVEGLAIEAEGCPIAHNLGHGIKVFEAVRIPLFFRRCFNV